MKQFMTMLSLLAFALFSTPAAEGQLVLQETFNTPTTDITTVTGWTPVTGVGQTAGGPPYIVVNPGSALVYPGYIESGVGNSAFLSGGGQDAQEAVATILPSGVVYLAFMIKVDTASAAGDYCWLVRNTSNHNRWRMWLKSSNSGTTYEFGLSAGSNASNVRWTSSGYTFGTTYLVVAKYDFNTTAARDAKLSLWVNPDPNSFGKSEDPSPVIPGHTDPGTDDFAANINRFALIQNDTLAAPTLSIGGIRMGLAWNTVLPPPPLYYGGTGSIDDPLNWGTNIDGSGSHPADFAADNQLWLVRNTSNVDLSSTWIVSGVGSRVVIGPGVNLTVASGGILSGTVDVNNGGVLTLNQAFFWPTFGDIAGTVSLDNSAGLTLDAAYVFPAGAGYYELTNGNLDLGGYSLTVKGRLRTNGNIVQGNGTFVLDSSATLYISSSDGLTLNSVAGDIQTTTRQYSRYANYTFAGTRSQVTGDGIPDTVAGLGIQMAHRDSTVTLAKPLATTGNLTLTCGKFVLGPYNLWFSNPSGQSDSSYVITDGAGALVRPIASTSRKTMPIGSATEYRVAVLTFEGTPNPTNIAFRYVPGDAGSAGLPDSVTRYYTGGYWTIQSDGTPVQTFKLDLRVTGIPFDSTATRILERPDDQTAWKYTGTEALTVFSSGVVSVPGAANFGQFVVAERTIPVGVADQQGLPGSVSLERNYPNPFNPATVIGYQLPSQLHVTLEIFNLLGQKVAKLVDETKPPGYYKATFDGAALSSGLYFYQLRAGSFVQTNKMLLLK